MDHASYFKLVACSVSITTANSLPQHWCWCTEASYFGAPYLAFPSMVEGLQVLSAPCCLLVFYIDFLLFLTLVCFDLLPFLWEILCRRNSSRDACNSDCFLGRPSFLSAGTCGLTHTLLIFVHRSDGDGPWADAWITDGYYFLLWSDRESVIPFLTYMVMKMNIICPPCLICT